jgi:hypothetical protein
MSKAEIAQFFMGLGVMVAVGWFLLSNALTAATRVVYI